MFRIALIIIFQFFIALAIAEPKITAHVTPSSGAQDDDFRLSISVQGEQPDLSPEFDDSEDFEVVSRGTNTQVQIINGNFSNSVNYIYTLSPKRVGLLTVPKGKITIGGETYETPEQQVLIKAGASAGGAGSASRDANIVFRQKLDKVQAYRGEQLINTIELLYRTRVQDVSLDDVSFDGFWQEILGKNENFVAEESGVEFNGLKIKRAIYPVKSGSLSLPARILKASVLDTRRRKSAFDMDFDPFDPNSFGSFFGGLTLVPKKFTSNALEVQVKELPPPPASLPQWNDLYPIVGKTDVIFAGDLPTEVDVGQNLSFSVEVRSLGSLQALKSLTVKETPGFKVYQDAPELKNFESAGQLMSRKTFSMSIVPTKAGEIHIPEFSIGFFDPEDDTYHVARSKALTILARGANTQAENSSLPVEVKQSSPQGEIVTPKTETVSGEKKVEPQPNPEEAYRDPGLLEQLNRRISWPLAILGFVVLLLLVLTVIAIWAATSRKDPRKLAEDSLKNSNSLQELSNNFVNWLRFRLGNEALEPQASYETLKQIVEQRVKSSDTKVAISLFLDSLQRSKYYEQNAAPLSDLKQQALKLLEYRTW